VRSPAHRDFQAGKPLQAFPAFFARLLAEAFFAAAFFFNRL
jgi:hypothetical protein